MWSIVLEAAGALAVLLFIVWWTMFSGRRGGELPDEVLGDQAELQRAAPASEQASPPAPASLPDQALPEGRGDEATRGGSKKLPG